MVSDEKAHKALTYLAETDESAAHAKALYEGLTDQLKTVYGEVFGRQRGAQEANKAAVYASPAYREHLEKIDAARIEWEIYRNKRHTAELIIEVWRSVQANRRRGNV